MYGFIETIEIENKIKYSLETGSQPRASEFGAFERLGSCKCSRGSLHSTQFVEKTWSIVGAEEGISVEFFAGNLFSFTCSLIISSKLLKPNRCLRERKSSCTWIELFSKLIPRLSLSQTTKSVSLSEIYSVQRNTRREYRTNADKDSYKRVLCLSSLYETQRIFSSDFVSTVLILSSFVEDARNDRVAFEDKTKTSEWK